MTIYGYARVSSDTQIPGGNVGLHERQGLSRLFQEVQMTIKSIVTKTLICSAVGRARGL